MEYYDAPWAVCVLQMINARKPTSVFGVNDTGNAVKMYENTQAALSHFLYNFLLDQKLVLFRYARLRLECQPVAYVGK
jgi:hypothetical protein